MDLCHIYQLNVKEFLYRESIINVKLLKIVLHINVCNIYVIV